MRAAYHAPSAIIAEAQLQTLARELEHTHPGAAGSLRESLAETLTVLRLGVLLVSGVPDLDERRFGGSLQTTV